MPITYRKQFVNVTEDELKRMTREEACLELNDKQRLFCEHYVANHNAVLAAKKAGYSVKAAHSISWKLRQVPEVHLYLAWLQLRIGNECHVNAIDIIDKYARIAFSDITDFIKIDERGRIKLVDGDMIDGQLVKSIKQGKDGVTVELHDKLAALQKLERYFDVMPKDWKQIIEEKKLEYMKERLEIERIKAGQVGTEVEDDGFLDALKDSATEVWDDEE